MSQSIVHFAGCACTIDAETESGRAGIPGVTLWPHWMAHGARLPWPKMPVDTPAFQH